MYYICTMQCLLVKILHIIGLFFFLEKKMLKRKYRKETLESMRYLRQPRAKLSVTEVSRSRKGLCLNATKV